VLRSIALAALTVFAAVTLADAAELRPMPTRDRRVLKRWSLSGNPNGVAVGPDGTVYVGLREPQSLVAIDPREGKILREVVLDSRDIAATKDFQSIRVDAPRQRLLIAQGSDESVTILSLPDLAILREIGLEGESIRDVIADPDGRYLCILGRRVHVWDAAGERELRTFREIDPMAIAVSSDGARLAIVGSETFASGKATVVVMIDTRRLEETSRVPLQTDREIEAALFAASDRALIVFAKDWLAEKVLATRPESSMNPEGDAMRIRIDRNDLVSSETICLSESAGPLAAVAGKSSDLVYFAERRCSTSGRVDAAPRLVRTASIYGIDALAIAYHPEIPALVAIDEGGFLTLYALPAPARHGS
jgi:hypothetical protein